MNTRRTQILAGALFVLSVVGALPAEPPVIPIGLDAYRQWERWPYQRIGARAYMRSTYDRAGGNEGAESEIRYSVYCFVMPEAAFGRRSTRTRQHGHA